MNVKDLSVTLHTKQIKECKEFYVEVLGARTTFDSGWYVVVTFINNMSVAFMESEDPTSSTAIGNVTLNILVEDIEAEYLKLKDQVNIICDLANQPWGDRSFQILDPIGNTVYIYMPAAVSDEYKDAVKE